MKLLQMFGFAAALAATPQAFAAYSLSAPQSYAISAAAREVVVGDVDGDGRDDVVTLTTSGVEAKTLFVYFQKADGTLEAPRKFAHVGTNKVGLALANLDQDGGLEIVVGHEKGITIFDWTAARKSMLSRSYSMTWMGWVVEGDELAVLDVDRDGHLDIIGQSGISDAIIYFGDGKAAVSRTRVLQTPTWGGVSVGVGDFNADGWDDYVVRSGNGKSRSGLLYLNNGSETPTSTNVTIGGSDDVPSALAVADVNGDGRDDIATHNLATTMDVYYRADNGTLLRVPGHGFAIEVTANALLARDLDLDGRIDIIAMREGSLERFMRNATGYDPGVLTVAEDGDATRNHTIAAGDVNGDGCPDIVSAHNAGIEVFHGSGCNIADLGVSLGLTNAVVSVRFDNYVDADAVEPEVDVILTAQHGTPWVDMVSEECFLRWQTLTQAKVTCGIDSLEAHTSRTAYIWFTYTGIDSRSALTVNATATMLSDEENLANNRASKTLRGTALMPTPALRAKTTAVKTPTVTKTTVRAKASR